MEGKIRLGISSCLLGNKVRYDGGHKLDHFLTDTLGAHVEYVPVCPEVEVGLPIPREALRLVGDPLDPRLVTNRSGEDITERMRSWASRRLDELEKEDLCGFIFKSGSPSSGMERVRVYDSGGVPRKTGVGIFAQAFMERFPSLPVEDEGRLNDPDLRENFIERIFALRRWRELEKGAFSVGALVKFHSAHKLQIMAHSPKHYAEMGRLVAHGAEMEASDLARAYRGMFLEALGHHATPGRNANVLKHIAGYFRKRLDASERQELSETVENYRTGLFPLIVPVTLINHYVLKYDDPYLKQQHYLRPHPLELKLRNHA
jgi:uncharacterized protein YbgA (DUF1722 family)/uncharacterized protein YbbK (DUF523 family)